MKKIRYGILGLGGIAQNRILKEGFRLDAARFEASRCAILVGAASRSHNRKEIAEQWRLSWYNSEDELLSDPNIDAVFIATNNLTHVPLAEKALLSGKHCIVEKPIATTVQEAERLVGIARSRKLSLFVNHMMQYNAYNREAAKLIRQGEIGKAEAITLHMEFLYGSTEEEKRTWRCADPAELGGPIGDVGSHCLYMAEFLMDSRIEKLSCVYLPRTLDIQVENGAFIQFAFANGAVGAVRVAFNQPRGSMENTALNLGYEVYGEKGAIRGYGTLGQFSGHKDEPVRIRLEKESGADVKAVTPVEAVNIYSALIEDHAQSILAGRPADGSDALHNMKLIIACHESARHGGNRIGIK